MTTAAAPLDLWQGAGVGHARTLLLRAHPLLHDGVIAGPAFGRAVQHLTASIERWPTTMKLWGIGLAGFIDAAAVQHELNPTRRAGTPAEAASHALSGRAWFADAGTGLRLSAAWLPGVVRIDVARGLRDNAMAVSVGWAPESGR